MSNNFFRIPNNFLHSQEWRDLPVAAKAIYPVIGCHCDKRGKAFPSQLTIAKLAGVDVKTARSAIVALGTLEHFQAIPGSNNKGQRIYRYQLRLPGERETRTLFFYRGIIDNGVWATLSLNAKIIYMTLRSFSGGNGLITFCQAISGDDQKCYADRACDFSQAEEEVLAEVSGLSSQRTELGLLQLESAKLICRHETDYDEEGWLISLDGTAITMEIYENSLLSS